jgi:long-chain acyl-CoA synthetase
MEKSAEMKQKIIEYMREKVAPYKVPRIIDFKDELPTSPVGKVLKRELRKEMSAK